jgi:hypothetical protein
VVFIFSKNFIGIYAEAGYLLGKKRKFSEIRAELTDQYFSFSPKFPYPLENLKQFGHKEPLVEFLFLVL